MTPDGDRPLTEAKGATASRRGSTAHGKPVTSTAVRINAAEALYTACAGVAARSGEHLAVAFQDDSLHRRHVAVLDPVLDDLEIGVSG